MRRLKFWHQTLALVGTMVVLWILFTVPVLAIGTEPGDELTGAPVGAEAALAAPATPQAGTLLEDHFGVTLTLQGTYGGGAYQAFDWNSFAPTLHADTVDWVEADWYGNWNAGDFNYTTLRGDYPSGGEYYDVEALYFDNDIDNFYIVVVTSVPHYWDWGGGHTGVGIYENRGGRNVWVRPGDLSLDLGLNAPRSERNGASWSYDFGVDIVHENRDSLGSTAAMRDNNVGASLYRTQNDAGGSDNKNPSDSDWYTSGPGSSVAAYWEHTNFDPESTVSTNLGIQYLGETTVDYYEYVFDGGALENNAATFIIEVTIPRALFGDDNPGNGDTIGIRWVEGCRNDGTDGRAVIYTTVEIDDIETGDAPDSTNHFGVNMSYGGDGFGIVSNFPTVVDPAVSPGGVTGMCHYVTESGAYLGATVSAERDADLAPDQDIPPYPYTNLDPSGGWGADKSDFDLDDGLQLPTVWEDGTPNIITYTVTVPAGGLNQTRYVNVWFDWDRDGTWSNGNVTTCQSGIPADEHVLINQPVNVAPGSSVPFNAPLMPCNPNGDVEWIWVRITLSDRPVSDVNDDGRGPGFCYPEGETEDWLFFPRSPTAVDLVEFTAMAQPEGISLDWETASEIDNVGFNIYRALSAAGPWDKITVTMIPSQAPGSGFGGTYNFMDTDVVAYGTYFYKLAAINTAGASSFFGPISETFAPDPTSVRLTGFKAEGTPLLVPALFLGACGVVLLKRRR